MHKVENQVENGKEHMLFVTWSVCFVHANAWCVPKASPHIGFANSAEVPALEKPSACYVALTLPRRASNMRMIYHHGLFQNLHTKYLTSTNIFCVTGCDQSLILAGTGLFYPPGMT